MYAERIQIFNYGPIDHTDITFPFNGENPKPVLLVGENGSGKSILLSHLVNGLMSAQEVAYPENSEVEKGKVYRFQSPSYIKSGSEYYWVGVSYDRDLRYEEVALGRPKKYFSKKPEGIASADSIGLWDSMKDNETTLFRNNYYRPVNQYQTIKNIFNSNCILYFPHNRFEEPAWLNEDHLRAKAKYMTLKNIQGYTNRKIINHSSLHDNQNWLFEVLYDSFSSVINIIFELPLYLKTPDGKYGYFGSAKPFSDYKKSATVSQPLINLYPIILDIIQQIFCADEDVQFRVGERKNRKVSLIRGQSILIPDIFQLSSGETALLNLFLSILRDFDLCGASFQKSEDIRGIVIVDEIDLHLHAIHQHDILPALIKLFPRVQFIVTTHSPLFVLGMEKAFGQDGFALYRLPQGEQISPEEFSEFGNAYQSFTATKRFSDDIKNAVRKAQKPIVFVEGTTDVRYIQKAAALLGQVELMEKVKIRDSNGFGNLNNIWGKFTRQLADIISQKIILLYDCEKKVPSENKGKVFKRSIPVQLDHPLRKGIENLFALSTLEKAKEHKSEFIDTIGKRDDTVRGQEIHVPEQWTVNRNEKTNLCNWLCENGTEDDFKHFQSIFDLLEAILADGSETVTT